MLIEDICVGRKGLCVAVPKIFVNIASYRDPECQWTLKDLFDKAENPDRVFVGICWQCIPLEDDDCFKIETRPRQVRFKKFHAKDSQGVGWARHFAQSLWKGEDFTLQIDSHMRFVPGWDCILLDMYAQCPTPKAILTTYPIPYVPPNTLDPGAIVTIKANYFEKPGILMFVSHTSPLQEAPPQPVPTAFCAAGFLFAPSQIIQDVPYDPFVYFHGEEITMAARLWTSGWDLFTPNQHVLYHDYTQTQKRTRHWKDHVDWEQLNAISYARVRHLFGLEISRDPKILAKIEQYGLGRERTLDAYEAFSGLNFKQNSIDGVVRTSKKHDGQDKADRKDVFTSIWENNFWGNLETKSGPGSTRAQTEKLYAQFLDLFAALNIVTLNDACCGDFNWMGAVAKSLDVYHGFDIVEPMIVELNALYKDADNLAFFQADVVQNLLPKADAILIRDGLTHFNVKDVNSTVKNFVDSGATYLIATTHMGGDNHDIHTGEWHPMDLLSAPFYFPKPFKLITESTKGTQKSLGVWRLADLASGITGRD